MRFLHLADVHLDTAFRCRSDAVRSELRRASRRALELGVEEAIRRDLDAVLIAGDLFDGDRLSVRTERFLGDILARLGEADIPVVYVTGNHDPGGPGGARSRLPWPEHVRVIDGPEPERVRIMSRANTGQVAGWVTGAGHDSPRVTEDLSRRFPRPGGEGAEVALLHSQVGGSHGEAAHDPYAPSDLAHLRAAGYDYWALGHVHARQTLAEDPLVRYPGNTQGRHARETGPKGGLIVELSSGGEPAVEFVELGPIRWETLRLGGLGSEHRLGGIARRIEGVWADARKADPGVAGSRWILRVELDGPSPLHRQLRAPEAEEELSEHLLPTLDLLALEVRTDTVRPAVRVEDHVGRGDLLGEALRAVGELSDAEGPSPAERLGLTAEDLAAAPEGPGSLDDYLRELLRDGEADLLDMLLDRGDR